MARPPTTRRFVWCASLLAAVAGQSLRLRHAAAAETKEEITRELLDIEGRSERLLAGYRTRQTTSLEARAQAVATSQPQLASSLFKLALRERGSDNDDIELFLGAAGAEALAGDLGAAADHYLRATALAKDAGQAAAAMEGFVAVVEQRPRVAALPALDHYLELRKSAGADSDASYEPIYRLGRYLARLGDARAEAVLLLVPQKIAAGRRASYVLGALALAAGEQTRARALFAQAAAATPRRARPDERARDAAVRDLSWLAVGRLAFEAGDTEAGLYAYHQVPVDSPRFAEAFLELGWLELDAGKESAAMLAFDALSQVAADTDIGRRAELLRGWVLLREHDYAGAEAHYRAVAARFGESLAAFDASVAGVGDLADLANDCALRQQALQNPLLRPVLATAPMAAARRLAADLESVAITGNALEEQLATLDALLGSGSGSLRDILGRDRQGAEQLLHRLDALGMRLQAARLRAGWLAAAGNVAPVSCCDEILPRLAHTRGELETLLQTIDAKEQSTRRELEQMRGELQGSLTEQRAIHATLAPEVRAAQRALAGQAVTVVRQELRRMVIEGEAGGLEAIWRYKEDHRESIRALEVQRRDELQELERRVAETIDESSAE
jgi:hypothetical protein